MVFYQVLLLSPLQCTVTHCRNCKRLREFEEIDISRQSCTDDCEYSREENSKDFGLDSVQDFGLCTLGMLYKNTLHCYDKGETKKIVRMD